MKILSGLFFVVVMLSGAAVQAQTALAQPKIKTGENEIPPHPKITIGENEIPPHPHPKITTGENEIPHLNILLSKDGTGIIRDIHCSKCNFNFVKITPKTQVLVNNVKVDIARVASRAGKSVFVQFNAKTAEVLLITWSE